MKKKILRIIDYFIFAFVFLFCLASLPAITPWLLKKRRLWENSAKGSPRALILRGFTVEKQDNRGFEHLLPFRNPSLEWIGILDAANDTQISVKITDDLYLIALQSPKLIKILEKAGFIGTYIFLRELVAIFKITSYCVKEKVGVLRAYKHNYSALQASIVSRLIKIPFIVDISGNYDLVRRITGKTFYFTRLNKIPFIRVFARLLTDWLLGWPLVRAYRVIGRDKCTYEHAFTLGAPLERLSTIRISNFNVAFNNYNPKNPPAKPAEYPYILFVGRLAKINLPIDVIDAFNIAAPQLSEYRLVIIGDGSIMNAVEEKRERSKFKNRIMLLGAGSNNTVLSWTAHAKIAVCPFSGSTLVEAMLCGIPVVAYDIAGHPEIVLDEYTGYLVPFRDVEALAQKIIYVALNYHEAGIIGMRGRELARFVFDKDKILAKESLIYEHALND